MKYWEIIADNLKKAGWSLGWVSAVDSEGRTIWIADAHRDNGKRFVVHAEEKLTAFVEHHGSDKEEDNDDKPEIATGPDTRKARIGPSIAWLDQAARQHQWRYD
ncbi:MAG TPA: hypothetical protein VFU09_01115, partial [Candidatus Udaeobacter sp.]|nr:hypothetical protein [Candidatus Udaeobacter sp.]